MRNRRNRRRRRKRNLRSEEWGLSDLSEHTLYLLSKPGMAWVREALNATRGPRFSRHLHQLVWMAILVAPSIRPVVVESAMSKDHMRRRSWWYHDTYTSLVRMLL